MSPLLWGTKGFTTLERINTKPVAVAEHTSSTDLLTGIIQSIGWEEEKKLSLRELKNSKSHVLGDHKSRVCKGGGGRRVVGAPLTASWLGVALS